VLAATILAQAGFLGTYSFISPLLTDRAAVPVALVPAVLVGFGVGALVGTVIGGRFGDRYPLPTIAVAVSSSAITMIALAAVGNHTTVTVLLVVLLGAFGLGANPVLIAQTLRYAGGGSTLASSLATSAFNVGTAGGSALAGLTLSTSLGLAGPAVLGAAITGSALAPLAVLARMRGARRTSPVTSDELCTTTSR
jgi:predicted MFS family arabinose efflux permease